MLHSSIAPTVAALVTTALVTAVFATAALATAALASGALMSPPPATAAIETCQGRPATIVGSGPETQGTPGDDVIVSGASHTVRADSGNDLVCVSPSSFGDVIVYAGPGNDLVDASASTADITVTVLGTGLDRFLGGPEDDAVHANGLDDNVTGADSAVLEVTGTATGSPGTYTGSSIIVRSASLDVEIELDRHILVAGGPAADIAGFNRAAVFAPRAVVRGDDEDNSLSASGCEVLIIGKGGDDDLSAGHLGRGVPRFECHPAASMRGGQGDDHIEGVIGRNRLVGNAGNDELHGRTRADLLFGGSGHDELSGGAGSDVLRGSGGNDLLTGDPGWDVANGNSGRDRCEAERELLCER